MSAPAAAPAGSGLRRLILHAGFHKTGTTSIQLSLLAHRAWLEGQGFTLPAFTTPRGKPLPNHSLPLRLLVDEPELADRLAGWEFSADPARLRRMAEQAFVRLLARPGIPILSGEDLSLLGEEPLQRLAQRLAAAGFRAELIVMIRSPFEGLVSATQERIKTGQTANLPLSARKLEALERLGRLQAVFETGTVLPFAAARSHAGGPVGLFLEALGLEPGPGFEAVRANESLSDPAVRLINHINHSLSELWLGPPELFRRAHDTEPLHRIAGPRYRLLARDFSKVRPLIQAQNAAMAAALGPAFCDPPGGHDLAERPAPWTEESWQGLQEALPDLDPMLLPLVLGFFAQRRRFPRAEALKARAMMAAVVARARPRGGLWQRLRRGG